MFQIRHFIEPQASSPQKPCARPLVSLDLSSLSFSELAEQLQERSLSCAGKKPELVARLWEAASKEGFPEMKEEVVPIMWGRGNVVHRREVVLPVERTMRVAKVSILLLLHHTLSLSPPS